MTTDQRIALMQAASTLAAAEPSATGGGPLGRLLRDRVLFYYGWLSKIVSGPYDFPSGAWLESIRKEGSLNDLEKPEAEPPVVMPDF